MAEPHEVESPMSSRAMLEDLHETSKVTLRALIDIALRMAAFEEGMKELLAATREAKELLDNSPAIRFQRNLAAKRAARRGES